MCNGEPTVRLYFGWCCFICAAVMGFQASLKTVVNMGRKNKKKPGKVHNKKKKRPQPVNNKPNKKNKKKKKPHKVVVTIEEINNKNDL
jgi:hypothetical protein